MVGGGCTSSLTPSSNPRLISTNSIRPERSTHNLPSRRKRSSPRQKQYVLPSQSIAHPLTWIPDFFGGNSTKATSGINGALTRTQVDAKIGDSVKQFYDDTLKSARDKARPDLIKVLTYKSAAAVEWLQDVFNLDLTLVSRLG